MFNKKNSSLLAILLVISLAGGGYQTYRLSNTTKEKNDLAARLDEAGKRIVDINTAAQELSAHMQKLVEEKNGLDSLLTAEQKRSDAYKNQIGEITKTVDTLTKLTQTDKELLQKYSRVYFLSENYVPSALTNIDTKYLYQKDKPLQIHDSVWPFLKRMLDAAADDQVTIQLISAYRSFGTQQSLKSTYKVTYGAGTANQFSADQGYSEHQLGTTLDLTTPELGIAFENFENTSAYNWLQRHAYEYGFILSYPKNNSFYQFEPWHWRFVGINLAKTLHDQGKNFYQLDQREIDKYLVDIFNLSI